MQIELDESVKNALEQRASAAGMSVDRYLNLLMEEQIISDSEEVSRKTNAIDAWLDHLKTASNTSGRNGRGWREYIHEGHAD
jgi:hypothetical protein